MLTMRNLALIEQLNQQAEDPDAVIQLVSREITHGVIACSFSAEDIVLIDLLSRQCPGIDVVAIDTGRLPEETYQIADVVRHRFKVNLNWLFPEKNEVEALLSQQGSYGFRKNLDFRQRCCQVRKVDVLKRGLLGFEAWYTGQRRGQSQTRQQLQIAESEEIFDPQIKVNPLAFWSQRQVWDHIETQGLPFHDLYRQGYTSIGCAPCTRAVTPGEDERAGRWWWESPTHKECGIHQKREIK
ncbi:MAG: phosphoadenylyl-sulfate reductase [Gammaproteobacteria bacterium]